MLRATVRLRGDLLPRQERFVVVTVRSSVGEVRACPADVNGSNTGIQKPVDRLSFHRLEKSSTVKHIFTIVISCNSITVTSNVQTITIITITIVQKIVIVLQSLSGRKQKLIQSSD